MWCSPGAFSRRIADDRPKQFCDILGSGATLLEQTADRVRRGARQDQIAYVMTVKHQHYYKPLRKAMRPRPCEI
jgi:mannose-1-phosphate guanylyltransferase